MSRLLSSAALAGMVSLAACAGSVDGEVDGDAVPALLSGAWFATDVGEGVQVTVIAASHLDVCGTEVRRLQAYTEVLEGFTDDVEGGDEVSIDDLSEALDEVDAETAPGEEYWTVGATLTADDLDEVAGETFDADEEGPGSLGLSVCHQTDLPERDENFVDKNADCYSAKDAKVEVGSFSEDGSIDLSGEAELVDEDDDDAGDVAVRLSAGACPDLEDANDDFIDALNDFFNAGPDGREGEGEGEGEPEFCSVDQDCIASRQLCDPSFGECAAPEDLAQCSSSFGFSPRDADPAGPLIFGVTLDLDSEGFDCASGLMFVLTAEFVDAEGDASFESPLDVRVLADVPVVDILGTGNSGSGFGGFLSAVVCLDASPSDLSVSVRDDIGNGSNVACAEL